MADPQQIIQSQTTIPDYARPYVENLLGQTAGVMYNYARDNQGNVIKDASGMPVITGFNPMEQYGGERTAQFTDLQKQAFAGAGRLGPDPYSQMAAAGMQGAAQRALNYGYNPSSYGNMYNDPASYQAGRFAAQQVNAPQLQQYQMQGPRDVQGAQAQAAQLGNAPTARATNMQAASMGAAPTATAAQTREAQLNARCWSCWIRSRGSRASFRAKLAEFANASRRQRQRAECSYAGYSSGAVRV